MNGQDTLIIVLTIMAFGLPVLYYMISEHTYKYITLRKLTKALNHASIFQLIIAVMFITSMAYLEKNFYIDGHGTDLMDVVMATGVTYLIIGAYFYVPGLLILNIISWKFPLRSRKS